MVTSSRLNLPSSAELPCSDDTPVDNEDQNFLPNVLLFLLYSLWADRTDWYFGVDMAVYHATGANPKIPVVPDGFLSLGVERKKGGKSRRSYAVWEESEIVPLLTLEMVSWTPGSEYDEKFEIYAKLGVLYYVIYNPEFWQRDRHQPFEIYKLVSGVYQLQVGEPYWMPEIGLGIGRHPMSWGAVQQESLAWFDQSDNRYLPPEDVERQQRLLAEQRQQLAEQRQQLAEQQQQLAEQQREKLAAKLRALGIDPDQV
jgi:Uma2 family endonuclease